MMLQSNKSHKSAKFSRKQYGSQKNLNSPIPIRLVGLVVSALITYVTVKGIYGDGNSDITSIGLVVMWSLFFLTQGVLWWVATSQGTQDVYQDVSFQRRM